MKGKYKHFEHDGVRGPNIATVYSDCGHGVRAPVVFYNRANEAGAMLKPGDFDWDTIFSRGVRWFHSGGIFAALSETTSEAVIEGMEAAKSSGAINSFDLNYRAKLWASIGGLERGQEMIKRIVGNVDALFGNEEDLQVRQVETRPRHVFQHDRSRRWRSSPTSKWSLPPCARSTRPTATTGARCCGSTRNARAREAAAKIRYTCMIASLNLNFGPRSLR